jgi:hypothetical protein
VLKRLPHGLTERANAAARSINFDPALKDGRPVSQWSMFEYNFNIYEAHTAKPVRHACALAPLRECF